MKIDKTCMEYQNYFPWELDLTSVSEEQKFRRLMSRILMASNFLATHNERRGPAQYIKISSDEYLNQMTIIAGMDVIVQKDLGRKIIVGRKNENLEDDILEFEFTYKNTDY